MHQSTGQRQCVPDPERLPVEIVQAIAEHDGSDPTDLERPLADVIDPEALSRLFSPRADGGDVEGYVAFRYEDYGVVVGADGRIEVRDAVEVPELIR